MQDEIHIFDSQNHALRSDKDSNAKLLNIVFIGGTFGNFLKYFLERFSKKTPVLEEDPFTKIGTSHAFKKDEHEVFSGLIQRYHLGFIEDNEGQTGLPVCLIVPSTKKHFLYLKQAQWFRVGDKKISPDDLWRKAIGEMPESIKSYAEDIIKLYDIKETAHFSWLPKFIVRDWYKLGFLMKQNETYEYKLCDTMKKHQFWKKQKVFELDLETFFNWKTFLDNIKEMDRFFGLELDFDKSEEMKQIFDRGLSMDRIRQECNMTDELFRNDSHIEFKDLNVATEAFIYAEMELRNKLIQMPLTNRFFRDKQEIDQFLEHFPAWYEKKNPNIE